MTEKRIGTLRIGSATLKNNIILAPMAGVTDLPFRLLCARQGAGLVCMEMVSAKAILYRNKNTDALMEIDPGEGQVSLQLFGSDPDIVSEMAKRIEERPFSILDINMGCPVPKSPVDAKQYLHRRLQSWDTWRHRAFTTAALGSAIAASGSR